MGYPVNYAPKQNVVIPPLPYQTNRYNLPDIHKTGGTGYINNYYNQSMYINDKVIVKDHYFLQPYHNREFIYGGANYQMGNVISSTSGCIPQFVPPQICFNYGQQNYGGYQQPPAYQQQYGGYGQQAYNCFPQQNNYGRNLWG